MARRVGGAAAVRPQEKGRGFCWRDPVKQKFTRREARLKRRWLVRKGDYDAHPYFCPACHWWHLGHGTRSVFVPLRDRWGHPRRRPARPRMARRHRFGEWTNPLVECPDGWRSAAVEVTE